MVDIVRRTLPVVEIVEAVNGLEAFEAFASAGADFLVTDHFMPRLDGPSLIRVLRRRAPELPILMVSVYPEAETEALTAGASWFLVKTQIMKQMPDLLLLNVAGRHCSPDQA